VSFAGKYTSHLTRLMMKQYEKQQHTFTAVSVVLSTFFLACGSLPNDNNT
jgi:hypothetical protein